jgi:Zn-dependent peptidase ImmA (M78 family)
VSRCRRADKDLARAVALDVLGKHEIDRAPVDPFAIADALGIVVQASDKLEWSFSGCLLRAENSFGILYSTGIRNKGYQRFTVAHELGHFSLTDHRRVLFEKGALHRSESGFTSGAWYEREADLFGVELLIPEFLFHRHRREFPTGLDGVKGLADLFETSLTATGIRYATLSTEPVAVVVSDGDRIVYSVRSKPFASRFGESAAWEGRARHVPANSVTRRFNAGGKVVSEERAFVRANDWFPRAEGEVAEEVIGLGRYGKTLTVLTVRVSEGGSAE